MRVYRRRHRTSCAACHAQAPTRALIPGLSRPVVLSRAAIMKGPTPDTPDPKSNELTPLREQQLLAAYRQGRPEALAELLRGYQGRVYGVCYRMLRSHDEATDLAQDALVKILEGIDSFDGRSLLSTWIIRVAMNCCLSYLRKQKLRRHASLEDAPRSVDQSVPSEPGALDRVQHAEVRTELLAGLARIDPDMRAIIVLRDFQDLDYHQIGAILGVPVGTVKSRLFRARAALRQEVESRLGSLGVPGDETGRSGGKA